MCFVSIPCGTRLRAQAHVWGYSILNPAGAHRLPPGIPGIANGLRSSIAVRHILNSMEHNLKRIHVILSCTLPLLAVVQPAHALQPGFSVGGRVGTLGIGPEVAVPVGSGITLRGGAGLLGFDLDMTGRFGLADNRTARLFFPKAFYTLGADVSLGGLRAGAGLLIKSEDPSYRITLDPGASIDIGAGTYTEPDVATLTTRFSWTGTAPYLLLGFGSYSGPGLGFFADIGAVILPDGDFSMTATGDAALLASQPFLDNLELEEEEVRDDAGAWINYWPIVSIGLRFGLGR